MIGRFRGKFRLKFLNTEGLGGICGFWLLLEGRLACGFLQDGLTNPWLFRSLPQRSACFTMVSLKVGLIEV